MELCILVTAARKLEDALIAVNGAWDACMMKWFSIWALGQDDNMTALIPNKALFFNKFRHLPTAMGWRFKFGKLW